MSKLLPEGFEIPEGTAYTLALDDMDDTLVTLTTGDRFHIERCTRSVIVEVDGKNRITLIKGGVEPVSPGRTVTAKGGSIAAGRDIIGSVMVSGNGNRTVAVSGHGNHVNLGNDDPSPVLTIKIPAPAALVLGKVYRVKCRVPLTVLNLQGFGGFFDSTESVAEWGGRHSWKAQINIPG